MSHCPLEEWKGEGWKGGRMEGGRMEGRMDGRMEGWKGGRMEGGIRICLESQHIIFT